MYFDADIFFEVHSYWHYNSMIIDEAIMSLFEQPIQNHLLDFPVLFSRNPSFDLDVILELEKSQYVIEVEHYMYKKKWNISSQTVSIVVSKKKRIIIKCSCHHPGTMHKVPQTVPNVKIQRLSAVPVAIYIYTIGMRLTIYIRNNWQCNCKKLFIVTSIKFTYMQIVAWSHVN